MYKRKFKEWGLQKYLKAKDCQNAIKGLHERNLSGKASEIIIRNRKVLVSDVERHVKRNVTLRNAIRAEEVALDCHSSEVICRTPSPVFIEKAADFVILENAISRVGTVVCLRCKLLNLDVS